MAEITKTTKQEAALTQDFLCHKCRSSNLTFRTYVSGSKVSNQWKVCNDCGWDSRHE